jgi:hypothetical protein
VLAVQRRYPDQRPGSVQDCAISMSALPP